MHNQPPICSRDDSKSRREDKQEYEFIEDTFVTIPLASPSKDMTIQEEESVHTEIRQASMFCGCLSILDWQ